MNERLYLSEVKRTINDMQACFLGQDAMLMSVVPEHLKKESSEVQAEYIARRLLFCMAKIANETRLEELNNGYKWLYFITLYLFERCDPYDRRFRNIIKLAELNAGVRSFLFDKNDKFNFLGKEHHPPSLLREYDIAVLSLMNTLGKIKKGEKRYKWIKKKFECCDYKNKVKS